MELLKNLEGMTADEQMTAVLELQKAAMANLEEQKQVSIGKSAELVIQGLKKIKSDFEVKFDSLNYDIQSKVASLKNGANGKDGPAGKDGPSGRDGLAGRDGKDGKDGNDGQDGQDGVSVTDANIDFDGSLIITLSSGRVINVGEVVAPDLAEKIKLVTSGGGTSQQVLDTLASLQTQIDTLIPSQTGNAGKFLTTNGTSTSWATVSGSGAVDSVNGQTGAVVLDAADVGAEPADATILKDADIGVTVQGYSAVLAGTTASFTTADETKLDGIAAGAEVNVNADWNATSGDAQILNKPTLGTAAAAATTDFATAAQGTKADSAIQPAAIGVTVQGYSSVLAGTTASFTTADETKLDGIAAGAEVNVNADWNAGSGDAQILNKPAILAFSGGITTIAIVSSLPGSPNANTLYVVV